MVKLIMGNKGSGKTVRLVAQVREAVEDSHNNVVVIEPSKALMYDIPSQARLVPAEEYAVYSSDMMLGFINGLAAGNYDITHVFIDNLFKIIGKCPAEQFAPFLDRLQIFSERVGITFVITVSAAPEEYGEAITKYICE